MGTQPEFCSVNLYATRFWCFLRAVRKTVLLRTCNGKVFEKGKGIETMGICIADKRTYPLPFPCAMIAESIICCTICSKMVKKTDLPD